MSSKNHPTEPTLMTPLYHKVSQNLFSIVTIRQFLFLDETLNYVIMEFLLSSLLAACVNLYVNEHTGAKKYHNTIVNLNKVDTVRL